MGPGIPDQVRASLVAVKTADRVAEARERWMRRFAHRVEVARRLFGDPWAGNGTPTPIADGDA